MSINIRRMIITETVELLTGSNLHPNNSIKARQFKELEEALPEKKVIEIEQKGEKCEKKRFELHGCENGFDDKYLDCNKLQNLKLESFNKWKISIDGMFFASVHDNKQKVMLLWTPRAACSIACQMMFETMGLLEEALTYNPFIHCYRADIYNKNRVIPPKEELSSWFILKTIVNPYRRAVSSYHHYCINQYEPEYMNISFYEYLMRIDQNLIKDCNAIQHCYAQYILGEESYVTRYYKMEFGQSKLDEINTHYGTKFRIDDKKSVHHAVKDASINIFIGHVKYNDIGIMPKKYSCFYDDKIKALVEKIYAIDIKYYNYKFKDIDNI